MLRTILHGYYLEIRPAIEFLVPVNASIEERIRIIRARRERLMDVRDSGYVYSQFQ